MGWIKERAEALGGARAHKGWLYAIAGTVILTLAGEEWPTIQTYAPKWIVFPVNGEGIVTIWGYPLWAFGVPLALLFLCGALVEYIVKLRRDLAPKIDVAFNSAEEGIVQTPQKIWAQGPNGALVMVREVSGTYVRLTVRSLSRVTIPQCVAFVTGLEKRRGKFGSFAPIPLPNPLTLIDKPLNIYPRVPRTIDFLKCSNADNLLEPSVAWPLTLRGAFKDHGTYRFTIVVVAAGVEKTSIVEIEWSGAWDTITGQMVGSS